MRKSKGTHMKRLGFIFITLAAAITLLGSGAMAQSKDAPSGNAEKGKKLWVQDGCYTCHGYDGHGGFGAKLAPRPIPSAAFIAIVRHPPPSNMPVFSEKVLPTADLMDMWAYLKSIPDPPALKDIPLLNQ
jgi:mono/diheme cytochrome c family protein